MYVVTLAFLYLHVTSASTIIVSFSRHTKWKWADRLRSILRSNQHQKEIRYSRSISSLRHSTGGDN